MRPPVYCNGKEVATIRLSPGDNPNELQNKEWRDAWVLDVNTRYKPGFVITPAPYWIWFKDGTHIEDAYILLGDLRTGLGDKTRIVYKC